MESTEQPAHELCGIERTRLLECKTIYWIDMNTDIDDNQKSPTYLDFQTTP